MSDVQVPTQAAGLFQKAHGRIVMLQRIEAQIAALLVQRRRLHSELTDAQAEINDEFNRLMNASDHLPPGSVADVSEAMRAEENGNGNANGGSTLVVPPELDQPVSGRIHIPGTVG